MLARLRYHAALRHLSKAEGDHGGHVIGHTAGGKPIYAPSHADHVKMLREAKGSKAPSGRAVRRMYPHFNAADHIEAAEVHVQHANSQSGEAHTHGHLIAQGHAAAAGHLRSMGRKGDDSNDKKLSPAD